MMNQDLFANLCGISSRQDLEVRLKGTCGHDALIPGFTQSLAKYDVFLQCGILYPGLLGNIGH